MAIITFSIRMLISDSTAMVFFAYSIAMPKRTSGELFAHIPAPITPTNLPFHRHKFSHYHRPKQ